MTRSHTTPQILLLSKNLVFSFEINNVNKNDLNYNKSFNRLKFPISGGMFPVISFEDKSLKKTIK